MKDLVYGINAEVHVGDRQSVSANMDSKAASASSWVGKLDPAVFDAQIIPPGILLNVAVLELDTEAAKRPHHIEVNLTIHIHMLGHFFENETVLTEDRLDDFLILPPIIYPNIVGKIRCDVLKGSVGQLNVGLPHNSQHGIQLGDDILLRLLRAVINWRKYMSEHVMLTWNFRRSRLRKWGRHGCRLHTNTINKLGLSMRSPSAQNP